VLPEFFNNIKSVEIEKDGKPGSRSKVLFEDKNETEAGVMISIDQGITSFKSLNDEI
jgi:hypothetical protein